MITGELKNKIDQLWEMLWTEGNANPLTNIEQLTYLLFMKDLDKVELHREGDAEFLGIPYEGIFPKDKPEYRWSTFKNMGDAQEVYRLMSQEIFPFIKSLSGDTDDTAFSRYMRDAIFQINKPATLQKAIAALDELPTDDKDILGDIYEYLLSKLASAGTNGQFRTPRHIIDMMVELMQPTIKDIISDPAMGSAGFLVSASRYLNRQKDEWQTNMESMKHFHHTMFHGNDMDTTMLRLGAMNMMLHGVENPQIIYKDSLSQDNEETDKYTLVLANPPFKGSLDYDTTANDLLAMVKTKKTELLFLALFLRTLKAGGRAAVIVPDGVLFGSSKAHKTIRQEIVERHKLDAVISMPSGVFKPYAGVSTAILMFTKTGNGGTDKVWFYDMKADGFSLDDKRQPIGDNDIPDIINRFHQLADEADRKRTEQSFFVPFDEIKANDFDLSINKYKEIEYEKVEYEPTAVILEKIKALETDNRRKPLNNVQRQEKSVVKKYAYCGANNIVDYIDDYIFDETDEILCIAEDGGSWGKEEKCTYIMREKCWVNNHAHVIKMNEGIDINYISLFLNYTDLTPYITGSTRGKLTKSSLENIELDLPDYETQVDISKKILSIQDLMEQKEKQLAKLSELVKSRFFYEYGVVV